MKRYIALALVALSSIVWADDVVLDTVTVTGGTNYQVQQKLSAEEFKRSFHVQETSPGMTSPYVGAYTGNLVDQTLNGVRMNNALFRSGPNQYFSWVPDSFVTSVEVSDGGNVGGTINRRLGIAPTHIGTTYNSAVRGTTTTGSYRGSQFGIAFSSTANGDVRTANGRTPNSAYNQDAFMAQMDWTADHRTTVLFSQSDDIRRTDKWNGGTRLTGTQAPSPYTYQKQQYSMVNHEAHFDSLDLNLAWQSSEENFLDKTKVTRTALDAYTVNAAYHLNDNWSVYSTNTWEDIRYNQFNDNYSTTKQGLRYNTLFSNGVTVAASAGMKQVRISGLEGFDSSEGSMIVGYRGWFASVDMSSNAPGYATLKQSKTSGRGTSIPNPDLKEERATTYRLGYKARGLYADVNYKKFTDAISSKTIAKDTYFPTNAGGAESWGAVLAYRDPSFLGTDIAVNSRFEALYGTQPTADGSREPTSKTVPFTAYVGVEYRGTFLDWMYASRDNKLSFSDQDDVRIYQHNDGYNLLNVGYRGTYQKFQYSVTVANLLNNSGRVLGSSVDVAGRSLIFGAKYAF